MRQKQYGKPYKIIGAYDSETTNYDDAGRKIAFPILHQLGILSNIELSQVTPENVEQHVNISMYRDTLDLYERLDDLIAQRLDYVPVIMCHNLAFDMYGLSVWLNRHDVRVLAKSERKPITFTINDEAGNPALVFWDTLVFTQQSLERMGNDCGYSKGIGEWDYSLVRTPATPLTDAEIDYAKRDIYTLFAWFGWWLRRNPDIAPEKLGLNVVTKTGIVRERRKVRFADLKSEHLSNSVGQHWLKNCMFELPDTDDELYTMMAATRGGFTFCASKNASIPFDLVGTDKIIAGYDATSQHPAQLVSHLYPVKFRKRPPHILDAAFRLVQKTAKERVLSHWAQPFGVAFYGCFEFENLRPKKDSIYEKCGILPLASARYRTKEQLVEYDEDNGDKVNYQREMSYRDYADSAEGAVTAFGKLVSADLARVYITELTAWEICRCYDFDSVKAISGYTTGRFVKPADMDVISVMQFYKAKNQYKIAREHYFEHKTVENDKELLKLGIAPAVVSGMKDGTISDVDVDATYQGLKADLNAIFGISCSNQFRRPTELTDTGITYTGQFGIVNAPKVPKVWYQFGQRIVGWSRIAQICAIELVSKDALTIINGDTDSLKILVERDRLPKINEELGILSKAIDKGKREVCARVKAAFPDLYDPLDEIGHYVHEFDADRFAASWNKAYAMHNIDKRDGQRHFAFTMAGIPTRIRTSKLSTFLGVNGMADRLYNMGWSFADVCNVFLGYNVTYAYDVLHLNGRTFPKWGDGVYLEVCDYLGHTSKVAQPAALALNPMAKTINDMSIKENSTNMRHALRNNPDINTSRKMVYAGGVLDLDVKDIFS